MNLRTPHLLPLLAALAACASTNPNAEPRRPSPSSGTARASEPTARVEPVQAKQGEEPRRGQVRGKLLAVGGGGTTPEIIERALELAGGKGARMLIVPQASSDPKSGEESKIFWMEHGALDVHVLDLADEPAALREVEQAAFIWMPGGDQSRLCEELARTSVPAAIARRYEQGALVGGTSAGAAALSRTMIIGGERADLKSVKPGGTQVALGLDLARDMIFDQHFVQRQRFTRLLACVLDHPAQVGIGIDEKTAVIVSGTSLEVIGDSSVLIVDARGARPATPPSGERFSALDVRLHVLQRGDRWELGRVRP